MISPAGISVLADLPVDASVRSLTATFAGLPPGTVVATRFLPVREAVRKAMAAAVRSGLLDRVGKGLLVRPGGAPLDRGIFKAALAEGRVSWVDPRGAPAAGPARTPPVRPPLDRDAMAAALSQFPSLRDAAEHLAVAPERLRKEADRAGLARRPRGKRGPGRAGYRQRCGQEAARLRAEGWSTKAIADLHGVSSRTVQRVRVTL